MTTPLWFGELRCHVVNVRGRSRSCLNETNSDCRLETENEQLSLYNDVTRLPPLLRHNYYSRYRALSLECKQMMF